eukprot:8062876-Heterocapsa_arctica.AAC.1
MAAAGSRGSNAGRAGAWTGCHSASSEHCHLACSEGVADASCQALRSRAASGPCHPDESKMLSSSDPSRRTRESETARFASNCDQSFVSAA